MDFHLHQRYNWVDVAMKINTKPWVALLNLQLLTQYHLTMPVLIIHLRPLCLVPQFHGSKFNSSITPLVNCMSSPNLSNLPQSGREDSARCSGHTCTSHVVVLLSCLAQPHPKLTEDRVGGGVFLSSVRRVSRGEEYKGRDQQGMH